MTTGSDFQNRPLLSFVIAACGRPSELDCLLYALNSQREYHVGRCSRSGCEVHRTSGPPCSELLETVVVHSGVVSQYGHSCQPSQFVCVTHEAGVGHHTRERGLEMANGKWIILTNQDNYYVGGFAHRLSEYMLECDGLIFWDCINNLWNWGNGGGVSLHRGCIDLGCVAVRAEVAKTVGFPWRNYDGDWDYIAACLRECKNRKLAIRHISETLFVHN